MWLYSVALLSFVDRDLLGRTVALRSAARTATTADGTVTVTTTASVTGIGRGTATATTTETAGATGRATAPHRRGATMAPLSEAPIMTTGAARRLALAVARIGRALAGTGARPVAQRTPWIRRRTR